jgi:hypothetical protein
MKRPGAAFHLTPPLGSPLFLGRCSGSSPHDGTTPREEEDRGGPPRQVRLVGVFQPTSLSSHFPGGREERTGAWSTRKWEAGDSKFGGQRHSCRDLVSGRSPHSTLLRCSPFPDALLTSV